MPTITKTQNLIISFISLTAILTTQAVSATISVPLKSKNGMVTSANPLASEAGLSILKKGGNAVDAAVATTLAISVVEPFSAGIGGGGFLLFHSQKTGEIKALDFRERAPIKATKNMYLDANGKVIPGASTNGYLAVATPGTVAGMYEVHRRYGKLPWQEVVKPSIDLAKNGFIISNRISWLSLSPFENRKPNQWLPDELRVEAWGLDALTLQDLRRQGQKIKETAPWGNANAIATLTEGIAVTENDTLEGAADPRGEGLAKGY
jgi:gamma-glutamyltranspeptidase/glutathione hydrolase